MSSSIDRDALITLLTNPFASVRVEAASLPAPAVDPCPSATNALLNLWQQLRAFVTFGSDGPTLAASFEGAPITVALAFETFGEALVSISLL